MHGPPAAMHRAAMHVGHFPASSVPLMLCASALAIQSVLGATDAIFTAVAQTTEDNSIRTSCSCLLNENTTNHHIRNLVNRNA